MLNKIIKEIENIKKSKKFTNKKIGIIISITTNPNTKEFEIFPLRDFADYVFVPISIKSDKNGILLAKEIDGKIDSLVFDTENKITSCQHLFDKINQKCKKTNVFPVKGNDFTSDSAYALIVTNFHSIKNKKICIIGAGNIGSKVALKLIETGTDVFIMNSNKASSVQTSKAINILKPSECSNNAIPISLDNMIKMDCIGGFTRGIPVINKKIVRYLKKDGLIIDGGTDNISQDGIEEAKKRNLKIIKLDVRYGFESNFRLMRNTKNLKEEVSGRKKINGINMVAGGIIGNKGDIIVDNITFPKKILGIADGLGRFEKNIEDYSEIIKKAEKTIKKKN